MIKQENKTRDFFSREIDSILKTEKLDGIDWLYWRGALERTRDYTDEQLMEFLTHANSNPYNYDIATRGRSDVDLSDIPLTETWGEFLRRIAAKVLQWEIAHVIAHRENSSRNNHQ